MTSFLWIKYQKELDTKRWKWAVFNIVRIAACLVSLLSFGWLSVDWDGDLLFSDWLNKF